MYVVLSETTDWHCAQGCWHAVIYSIASVGISAPHPVCVWVYNTKPITVCKDSLAQLEHWCGREIESQSPITEEVIKQA